MKKFNLFIIAIAGFVACTPKASPSKTNELIPTASNVKTGTNTIQAGQTIFTTQCTRCHENKYDYISQHSYEDNRSILASMVQKARLNTTEIEQVSAYVHANSKK